MDLYYFSSGPRERVLNQLLAAGHQVRGFFATPTERHPKVATSVALAREHHIPIHVITDKAMLQATCLTLDPDCLVLSVGFAYLFQPAVVEHFKLMLNVHGTLLPDYPGQVTLNWIVENEEPYSGVTVHRIDASMDTGAILHQARFTLDPFETGTSLYERTLAFEPEVVLQALALLTTDQATWTPQRRKNIKIFPDRKPEHSRLEPEVTLQAALPKIRAAHPERYPAHVYKDEKKIGLHAWLLPDGASKPDNELDSQQTLETLPAKAENKIYYFEDSGQCIGLQTWLIEDSHI